MSDSNRVQLAYVEESTFGEVESGGNLQVLRFTSESLHQETTTQPSNEIRDDRQVTDVKRTKIGASGAVNLELSYGSYDDLLQAALMSGAWSSIVTETETTFSMAVSDNSVNDSASGFVTAGYAANQWAKISGFTTTANNGYFKIVSVVAGKMVLSGGTVADEVAGDSVTIKMGAQIVNGTTCPSFNIEKKFADLSNKFAILTGMCLDQMSLNIAADAIINGTFNLLGKSEASAASSSGTGYDSANSNETLSAIDDVTSILENQISYDTTQLSLQLQNNLRDRIKVGSLGTISIGKGVLNLTGTIQAYFEDSTVMDKYLNFTSSSLAIVIEDGSENAYIIDLPQIKYTSGQRVAGGQNQDIIADMAFNAYRNSSEDVTIRIARFAA